MIDIDNKELDALLGFISANLEYESGIFENIGNIEYQKIV